MKSRIERPFDSDQTSEDAIRAEYADTRDELADTLSKTSDETEIHDLLAGYQDEDGVIHKTFTVREMTGEDEEYINRADVRTNGAKVTTALLTRCTLSVGSLTRKSVGSPKAWEDIFKKMFTGDRDVILMQIRKDSMGGTIKVTHVCPNPDCKAKLQTEIDIDELGVTEFDGLREIPFDLPRGYTDRKGEIHKRGTMRRPNGLDSELLTPLAKNNLAKATTTLLTRICRFEDGTHIDDSVMAKLTTRDRQYLQELLDKHQFGVQLTVDVMCDRCGESFQGNLNQSNFM